MQGQDNWRAESRIRRRIVSTLAVLHRKKEGLGAGEEVALTASSTAACGGEGGSGGEDGEEMELGAGAGEEWSGV